MPSLQALFIRCCGSIRRVLQSPRGVRNRRSSRKAWEGLPEKVIVLYAYHRRLPGMISQVPRDTCNPVGSWGDHPPRLNTHWRPIANKYREGKVKRTPGGE